MDLMKIHGDIYRVKLIIVMPRIRSVLLLIDWLIQKADDAKLINGELYPSATIVDRGQSNNYRLSYTYSRYV